MASTAPAHTTEADVVVVGLGVMGAAALDALAGRGLRVVGIDRHDLPHAWGSSHGGTRVIRKAYYEDPAYVPWCIASWEAWRQLEADASGDGAPLLLPTGGLHFGPEDSPDLAAVRAAAELHGLACEALTRAEVHARLPQFALADGEVGLFERDAGVLFAERCTSALLRRAMARGARVLAREPVMRLALDGPKVLVQTATNAWACERVVLALGPWWPTWGELPAPLPLTVTRQVQVWFASDDAARFSPDRFPIFMRYAGRDTPRPLVYGLPEAVHPGVKLAQHAPGTPTSPEAVDREVSAHDLAPLRAFAAATLRGVRPDVLGARVCLYSMSPDGHFGLGLHPADPRVVCALGFSGHGFKLAPSVGRALAELAIGGAAPPGLFALTRFGPSSSGPGLA